TGDGAYALAFSPDGGSLAVAGADDVVTVYDIATDRPPEQAHLDFGSMDLAFRPGGGLLIASEAGLLAWNDRGAPPEMIDPEATGPLAVAPDGRVVACAGGALRLWASGPPGDARELPLDPSEEAVALALSPDGRHLAAGLSVRGGGVGAIVLF